jgi:RNA polymerase sigma-54 factor
MEHAFFQSQKMKQEQILAPQQLQSLEILSLPVTELQQKINEELQLNPTLEVISTGAEALAGDPISENNEVTREEAINAVDKDESLIGMVQLEGSYYGNGSLSSDQEDSRQHFFDSLTEEPDLADFLLSQIHRGEMIEADIEIANVIISSLNERGYLNCRIEEIAFNANCTVDTAEEILEHLQKFDPPGIAARDLRECLLNQISKTHTKKSTLYKVI